MHMFQKRAKGTALARNSHAMLTLQSRCSKYSHGTSVTPSDFNKGVTEALRASPDGPVAQWILRELQDLACTWTRIELPAAADAAADAPLLCYYANVTDGTSTWSKPAVVAAMERFDAMRDAVQVARKARRAGKLRASTFKQQRRASIAAARGRV
tara:strand:- start:8 stop:472 length:465 start_codon:yes stop_codon:yes gene_type:complete